jgi:hypothetical protein
MPHAADEMAADRITTVDCGNVLRAGVVDEAEWENGEWRYRVRTPRFELVVTLVSDDELLVITAWRKKQ